MYNTTQNNKNLIHTWNFPKYLFSIGNQTTQNGHPTIQLNYPNCRTETATTDKFETAHNGAILTRPHKMAAAA